MLIAATDTLGPLFGMLAIVLVLSLSSALLSIRLGQSILLGYFLCGIIAGPLGALEWLFPASLEASALIHLFAELGIVLLMFTIGIEFDTKELSHLRKAAFLSGSVQIFTTALIIALGAVFLFQFSLLAALLIGLLLALSSTALALKSFQDMGMNHHPAARTAFGIALLQDVLVVAILLFLPSSTATATTNPWHSLFLTAGKGIFFLGGCGLLAKFVLPTLFDWVTKTKSRELFTLCVAALCLGIAFLANSLGLNLALGAFAAGAVISGSVYRHRVLADIHPFKDLFLAIFFVSVGLQIDLADMINRLPLYLGSTIAILLGKACIVFFAARLLGLATKACLYTAFSLASLGEFALVLFAKIGTFSAEFANLGIWLAGCTALTMSLVPSLLKLAPKLTPVLEKLAPWLRQTKSTTYGNPIKQLKDHAIIVGYGPVGKQLHRSLLAVDVPVVIIELNAKTVQLLRAQSIPVLFADIRHLETLELAQIEHARALILSFPDLEVAEAAISNAKHVKEDILIFARTKFASERTTLEKLGVKQVIHDEKESSYALARAVLHAYDRDETQIATELARLNNNHN